MSSLDIRFFASYVSEVINLSPSTLLYWSQELAALGAIKWLPVVVVVALAGFTMGPFLFRNFITPRAARYFEQYGCPIAFCMLYLIKTKEGATQHRPQRVSDIMILLLYILIV